MRLPRTVLLIALTAASGAATAQDTLGMAEVKSLITEKTVDIVILSSGQPFRSYHAASGDMIVQRADAMEFAGRWKVREDGSHCVYFDRESCGKLSKNADGTYTRIVDGVPTFRWVKITPGKDF